MCLLEPEATRCQQQLDLSWKKANSHVCRSFSCEELSAMCFHWRTMVCTCLHLQSSPKHFLDPTVTLMIEEALLAAWCSPCMVCKSHGRSPWTQISCHRANPAASKRRTSGKRLLKVQENPRWREKRKSQRKTGRSASLLAEPRIVHGFFMILSCSSRVYVTPMCILQ